MYDGFIGINVRTLGVNRDNTLAYIRSLQSAFTLAQDDPALAAGAESLGSRAIYRQSGDEDINVNPLTFVSERARNAPTASYIHTFNEITPSAVLARQEIENMKVAESLGRKACIINAATNKSKTEWDTLRPAIERAAKQGHAVGVHVYLDGLHDGGAFEWVPLMEQYGGTWVVTEFGYIKSIFDANTGWRTTATPAGYGAWFRTVVRRMHPYKAPLLVFSYDHWQPNDYGREKGFGFADDAPVTDTLIDLNRTYKWTGATMPAENPTPPPDPTWEKRRLLFKGDFVNLRPTPATTGMPTELRVTGIPVDYATNRDTPDPVADDKTRRWYMLRVEGKVGYMRSDVASLPRDVVPAPPPPVDPPPAPPPVEPLPDIPDVVGAPIGTDELQNLIGHHLAIAQANTAIVAIYRTVMQRMEQHHAAQQPSV